MIITAPVRAEREKFRRNIERAIAELESLIVPGLSGNTVQVIRDEIETLKGKLRPEDDKRNPKHYRRKPQHTESWPVRKFNADDWNTAVWLAKKRTSHCELCAAAGAELYRLREYPANHQITGDHVEAVCTPCAARVPREEYFA